MNLLYCIAGIPVAQFLSFYDPFFLQLAHLFLTIIILMLFHLEPLIPTATPPVFSFFLW
jgi:hypothetical protein